jgi:hypothetical protein
MMSCMLVTLLYLLFFSTHNYPELPRGPDGVDRTEIVKNMVEPMYGKWPQDQLLRRPEAVVVELPELDARYLEWVLYSARAPQKILRLGVFLPRNVSHPALFLSLNKCGNHTLHAHPLIPQGSLAFQHKTGCKGVTRGSHRKVYGLDVLLRQGLGLATFAEADMDADSPTKRDLGIRALYPHDWGAISAWAWGLSQSTDHLKALGYTTVITTGHSRRGKAALLAAALNTSIDAAFPHQSGLGGTASLRGAILRESAKLMTHGSFIYSLLGEEKSLHHFFAKSFKALSSSPENLPFDAHHLMALVAPRPLIDFEGTHDYWAGPVSARDMLHEAAPAWQLAAPVVRQYGESKPTSQKLQLVEFPWWHVQDERFWQEAVSVFRALKDL